jgi:hypothetical protein
MVKFLYIVTLLTINSYYTNCQDYTIYNNLSTTAKKYFLAERYYEANCIFESINKNYQSYYKSIDLYYWASTLVLLKRKNEAFEKLILAQKRLNDCWSIEYRVNNDTIFNYLNEEELLQISNTQPETKDNNNQDSLLYDSLVELHEYDNFIQYYIEDSLFMYKKGTTERIRIQNQINQMNKEVSDKFCKLIIQYGLPESCYLMGLCELFLAHLDSEYWVDIEPVLQKSLKNGKLSSFTYAYTYFRTHNLEDKYGALYFPEFSGRNQLLIDRKKFAKNATIGVGI